MHLLDQSILLNMLGWALFNSLWQISLLWLIYIIVTAGGKNFSANTRHSIALFLLGAASVWFIYSLIANFLNNHFSQEAAISFNILSGSKLSFIVSSRQFINFLLPYCSIAYLIAIGFLVARYLKYYILSQRLKQTNLSKAPVELRIFVENIAARIGIHKKVKLWFSSAIKSPMTIGFLKPVILIPLATMNHLTTQQMEAVLLHELSHIKRNDYLVNLLISVTEIIFFFNPFAMLLVHAIKKEREHSCDDLVLQFRYDSCVYASALLSLEKARNNQPQLAMAAVGKNNKMLLQRVLRITGHKNFSRDNKTRLALFVLIGITASFAALVKPEMVTNLIAKLQSNSTAKPSEIQQVTYTNQNYSGKKKQKPLIRKKNKAVQEKINEDKNVAYENADFVSSDEEQTDPANNETLTAVVSVQPKDYSMPDGDATVVPQANTTVQGSPYVPSTSFSYNEVEDTDAPKRTIDQINKEAKEADELLQKAMSSVNLKKVAKSALATRKVLNINIEKIQNELQKNAGQLDYDNLKKDVNDKLTEADEMRLRKDLEVQIQTLQSLSNANSPKAKQLSQEIMRQQIKLQQAAFKKQQELIRKLEQLNKKLKIVYI